MSPLSPRPPSPDPPRPSPAERGEPRLARAGERLPAGEREEATATAERPRAERPRRFKVLLHNDDYTTMEYVVEVLERHFHKSPAEATHVMLQVHHKGVGVAGVYPKDVAETKVAEVMDEARGHGMPLLLSLEESE